MQRTQKKTLKECLARRRRGDSKQWRAPPRTSHHFFGCSFAHSAYPLRTLRPAVRICIRLFDIGPQPQSRPVNILIVKLSSLGDVVHAMPAVQDLRAARPHAAIDWVVEGGFAPLVQRCAGVRDVIGFGLRRWRKAPLAPQTRAEWRAFREQLRGQAYDAVTDLLGDRHGLAGEHRFIDR